MMLLTTPSLAAVANRSSATAVGLLLGAAAAVIGVGIPGPLNPSTILVGLASVVALRESQGAGARTSSSSVGLIFALYIFIRVTIEILNASRQGNALSVPALLDLVVAFAAFTAARCVVRDRQDLCAVIWGLVLPSVVVSVIALLQIAQPGVSNILVHYVSSGGLEARLAIGRDIRATSIIGHHAGLGGYLAGIIAAYCCLIALKRADGEGAVWPWLLVSLSFVAQVATLTFATIGLSAAVVAALLVHIRVKPLNVVIAVTAVAICWLALGGLVQARLDTQLADSRYSESYGFLPETVGFRMRVWTAETLPAIMERPATGWGINVYSLERESRPRMLRWFSPESEYLRTAIAAGFLGLAAQILLIFSVWRRVIRPARGLWGGELKPLSVYFVGILAVSLLHSHLSNRGVPLILWPMIGVAAAVVNLSSHSPVAAENRKIVR